ncbi:MAG: isocitrate lyase/phosphoenolpyruvate mutase family protein [Chitinophagales bacterium]|nr:isocitrate lyase/phosphoenolpyruvate mutase family protein [Chitinophagales bacterium]
MDFKELHKKETPILVCNVWDVESARVAQNLGFRAIGTSSGAIATMLGYKDGEEISFSELEYIVERIIKSSTIPLTVDLEAGYSRKTAEIVDNIKRLAQLGVVGINIEDSLVEEKRTIVDTNLFSKTLTAICSQLLHQNIDLFVNVRTDTFLLGLPNPLQQTIQRAKEYYNAGAQGLFVPCIEKREDIKVVAQEVDLPLNVMCMPNLPAFSTLKGLGVKRISMGNFVYNKINKVLKSELEGILINDSFQNLFAR